MTKSPMKSQNKRSFPQEMKGLSKIEGIEPDKLARLFNAGRVVIPSNPRHKNLKPCAIGEG